MQKSVNFKQEVQHYSIHYSIKSQNLQKKKKKNPEKIIEKEKSDMVF